jgi:hypothetical protein
MYWARDHHGNDVPAWEGGISAYGLVCPTCGEPVMRRAGLERRAHFAHFSLRARPDCENYFPSVSDLTGLRGEDSFAADLRHDRSSLSCGLFLEDSDSKGGLNLWLRIPSAQTGSTQSGKVNLETGLGLRSYQAADLLSTRLVPLRPQVPLAKCNGTGGLLSLAARISAELDTFRRGRNLFYADERGGRLVFSNELLEWGVHYRLLIDEPLEAPPHLSELLSWKRRPKLDKWFVYAFSLPAVFSSSRGDVRPQIETFLGRRVGNTRPRLFVVEPTPHHIDSDGTYVYPAAPSRLLLRRTVLKSVRIKGPPETVRCVISELSDEWVQIVGIPVGKTDCIVSIDGDEQLVFRIAQCGLFRPTGVLAHCGNNTWELASDPPLTSNELIQQEVSIECHSERLASHLAVLNPAWGQEALHLRLPAAIEKVFTAGSFGRLFAKEEIERIPEGATERSVIQGADSERKVWVEGLIAAAFGEVSLGAVREYLADPVRENLFHLGPLISSPLMPYIYAAHDQIHGR